MKKLALTLCLLLGLLVNSTTFAFQDHQSIARIFIDKNFSGTGFIFNKSGCILTQGHVIGYNKEYDVVLGNGLTAFYVLSAVDPIKDIGVICPKKSPIRGNWTPLQLGLLNARDIERFQDIFVTILGFHIKLNAFVSEIYKVVGVEEINSYPIKTKGWKVTWEKWHIQPYPGYSGSPLIHGQAVIGTIATCEGKIDNFKYCLAVRTNEIIPFLKERHIAYLAE